MYQFSFRGGVTTINFAETPQSIGVKFLVFLLSENEETPLWTATKYGIATYTKTTDGVMEVSVPTPYLKVFIRKQVSMVSGDAGGMLTLICRLGDEDTDHKITIYPFDKTPPSYFLSFHGTILGKKAALDVLRRYKASPTTVGMVERQGLPPKAVLQKMIKAEKRQQATSPLGAVRRVRL